ncbi:helix-turn-helix domain-containing protein [Pontibacter sp. 172403-2]|uniref:helix-turn-helix transcriptional regulator n=1 Tax=Pontibacter rufus TaxID=2791028 RepID=UPI0018AF9222|nr:helix-turn-helix transcriptional regulator [Pontibacter sp. 172403-2]MBF9255031.1 helix-turn-helix domain-containing protein [Pontibacter sp. 172403-2]
MEYNEIKPCTALEPYIHSFWELKGDENDRYWERNFPDGCSGLVLNAGSTCITDNGTVVMNFGKTYVAGAMTSFKDSFIESDTHLFGVCLKPGAFSNFYNYAPQNELTDKTVQLENTYSFDVDKTTKNPVHYLNSFFIDRLQSKKRLLQTVIDDIHHSNGQLSINEIAKRNFTSIRQLERNFKTHVGITPKAYANIVRFQNALTRIKNLDNNKSLLDIAFECGFYDHSHLTNEIKRNTGLSPSQL